MAPWSRLVSGRPARVREACGGQGRRDLVWSCHHELVRADLDVLGHSDGLAFLEDAQAEGLFHAHVQDVVLTIFPALHMGILIDDECAQVLAVEHQDVRGAGLGVEVHERADQDAERDAQVVGQLRRRGHVLVVARGGALALSCIEYILIITPLSS